MMTSFRNKITLQLVLALIFASDIRGFLAPSPSVRVPACGRSLRSSLPPMIDTSSVLISVESWRQYVPLVVSVGVIVDILLGRYVKENNRGIFSHIVGSVYTSNRFQNKFRRIIYEASDLIYLLFIITFLFCKKPPGKYGISTNEETDAR